MPAVRRSARLQSLTKESRPKSSSKPRLNVTTEAYRESHDDRHREVPDQASVPPPLVAVKEELLSEPDFALIEVKKEPLSENSEGSKLDHLNKLLLEALQREAAMKVLIKSKDDEIRSLQEVIRELKA